MRGAFVSPVLSAQADRLDDARDRALLTDLTYGALRHLIFIDACLAPRLDHPERLPARVRDALRLATYELLVRGTPPHAVVNEWVEIVGAEHPRLRGLVNAVLRRVAVPGDLSRARRLSLPDWLLGEFDAALGEHSDAAARAMLEPTPLWLSELRPATAALEEDGCAVTPGPVPGSLAARCPVPPARLTALRAGLAQPQNPASRLPPLALAPDPGARTLDLAGGNGIKAAQLAAAGARVTSVELDPGKSERARAHLTRAGLAAEFVTHDLRTVPPLAPAPFVLLDAPCTGSGTLRGHPEIKLRLTPPDVAALAALQAELLDTAAALTQPGGTLVYSVCSLTPREGPEQAAAFLGRHPEFAPEPLDGAPYLADTETLAAGPGLFALPTRGLDGFYLARLRRAR